MDEVFVEPNSELNEDLPPPPPSPLVGDDGLCILLLTIAKQQMATNEKLAGQNEAKSAMQAKILKLMERQAQLVVGTQVVVQSKDSDPNSLYEKFRKRGALEFIGSEDPLQVGEWIVHAENIYEKLWCTGRQRVALVASMFLNS